MDSIWDDVMMSEELLKDFYDHLLMCFVTTKGLETPSWQPPFNNGLIILNLAMHGDEATPGIHLICIPYARNCKRGPAVQPSVSYAFTCMGYPSTWKDALDKKGNPIPKPDRNGEIIHNKDGSIRYKKKPDGQGVLDWIEDPKRWLQKEMMRWYDWSREYKDAHPRGNLSILDCKVTRAKERRWEIEKRINAMPTYVTQHLDSQIERLDESIDKVWESAGDLEIVIRYLNICLLAERKHVLEYAQK